jgi:hypothetical protein
MGRSNIINEKMIAVVKNCIDGDRRQTVREISEIVDVRKTTVHCILSDELNMSRVCARLVLRLLKYDEKERRVAASSEFFKRVTADDSLLDRTITCDETWLHHFEPEGKRQSSAWKTPGTPPPKRHELLYR